MNFLRKDWPLILILIFWLSGLFWCLFDLFSDREEFIWDLWRVLGIVLILTGRVIEYWVRNELKKKAKFPNFISTLELRINQDHRLLTTGLFKHVRHPLYSGIILQGLGWALLTTSVYGSMLLFVGSLLLIPRIQLEEDMLIKQFDNSYRAYQKTTKKLIPFIY